jgi:hypothetical protein
MILQQLHSPSEPGKRRYTFLQEYWGSSSSECGEACGRQAAFKVDFAGIAKELEQGGYTLFTPHFLVRLLCVHSSIGYILKWGGTS